MQFSSYEPLPKKLPVRFGDASSQNKEASQRLSSRFAGYLQRDLGMPSHIVFFRIIAYKIIAHNGDTPEASEDDQMDSKKVPLSLQKDTYGRFMVPVASNLTLDHRKQAIRQIIQQAYSTCL
jgi:hypothetical protein